jgi:hypothetical protein
MSFANVLIYVALIAYVLYGKARGRPMKAPKRLFLLPVLLVIIGYGDAAHGATKPLEVTLTVIGGTISLGLGLLRGRADKISYRDGSQFVQWGILSFALFAANLVAKLVLDLIGIAGGLTFSEVGKSLILTLGITLLGEAIALLLRSGAATGLINGDRPGPAVPRQAAPDRFADVTTFSSAQAGPADDLRGDRRERHDHHEHHDHHHSHHGLTGPS